MDYNSSIGVSEGRSPRLKKENNSEGNEGSGNGSLDNS